MLRKSIVLLDMLSGGADTLPTEFRLFKAGLNKTLKGDVILDAAGLADILKSFAEYGNDLVLDLEHKSIPDDDGKQESTDAMAWFKLADKDGDLWATDVKWTPEGESRLRAKKQRYVSPAVLTDKDNRATRIVNGALVSMPATLKTPALVAASQTIKALNMNLTPEMIVKATEAMAADDLEALKAIVAELMAGAPAEEKPPEEDPAMAEMAATSGELLATTGQTTLSAAIETVKQWATTAGDVAKRDAALQLSARLGLVGKLVKLGAETPATAYADKESKTLAPRLLSEDLSSLKTRVGALEVAAINRVAIKPPGSKVDENVLTLSATELAACKKRGFTPEEYAARKAAAVRTATVKG